MMLEGSEKMAEKNTKASLSALDSYVNRVYVIVVLLLPIFCLCASSSITIIYYMGLYPHVNEKPSLRTRFMSAP